MNSPLKNPLTGCLLVPLFVITSTGQTSLQFNRLDSSNPGQLMFELQGPTNRTLIVESSTNLLDWRFLWEATPDLLPPDGVVSSTVDLGQFAENVFLRAVYVGRVTDPDPLFALEGEGSAAAVDILPDMGMPSVDPDRIDVAGGALPVSLPDILATLAHDTTVQQLNDLLSAEGLIIAGSLGAMNLLLLCDPAIDSRSALQARITQLKSTGLFSSVAPNIGLDIPAEVSPPASPTLNLVGSPGGQSSWSWDVTPLGQGTGGNNAFELSRIPQLWNWLDYGYRQKEFLGGHRLAVVEFAFYTGHEELPEGAQMLSGNTVSIRNRRHGTAVTGIVAAERNNDLGIEGVTPLLQAVEGVGTISVADMSWTSSDLNLMKDLLTRPVASRPRVLNMSYGTRWGTNNPTAGDMEWFDDCGDLWADGLEDLNEEYGGNYLVFCAAGNDGGVDARYVSPMANIACRTDLSARVPNFITVEAVNSNGVTSAFSNRDTVTSGDEQGQSISAGGEAVTVLSGPGASVYQAASNGTSYSSPLAAGVASFLWTLDPSLTVENVKFLLSNDDTTMDVPNGANLIDAFAAALQIDLLRDGDPLQKALVDVDDGTLDGNLRAGLVNFSENPDQIHTYDGRRGDGLVDMRDFRAFRDAWLHVTGQTNHLDGPPTHFKRDLNGDGQVDGQPVSPPHPAPYYSYLGSPGAVLSEDVYSRFDFNGNGRLDKENLESNPPTNSLAPFKVDPDTPVTTRSTFNGIYRDIDVMLRPSVWDVNDENVVLSGAPSYPDLLPENWTTNDMSLSAVTYLQSFDFHVDMEGGSMEARDISYLDHPFTPVQEGLEIASILFGERKGRVGEWKGVVTIPFNDFGFGEYPKMTVSYRRTSGNEFRQYQFNFVPKIGEDIALILAFDDLQFYSNTREFKSYYLEGSGNPVSTEAIGRTPGSGPYGDFVIPFEEATSEEIRKRAREAAVDALADKLKFPVALNGSPSLEPIFKTIPLQNADVLVEIYGLKAVYNVIEGLPASP